MMISNNRIAHQTSRNKLNIHLVANNHKWKPNIGIYCGSLIIINICYDVKLRRFVQEVFKSMFAPTVSCFLFRSFVVSICLFICVNTFVWYDKSFNKLLFCALFVIHQNPIRWNSLRVFWRVHFGICHLHGGFSSLLIGCVADRNQSNDREQIFGRKLMKTKWVHLRLHSRSRASPLPDARRLTTARTRFTAQSQCFAFFGSVHSSLSLSAFKCQHSFIWFARTRSLILLKCSPSKPTCFVHARRDSSLNNQLKWVKNKEKLQSTWQLTRCIEMEQNVYTGRFRCKMNY